MLVGNSVGMTTKQRPEFYSRSFCCSSPFSAYQTLIAFSVDTDS